MKTEEFLLFTKESFDEFCKFICNQLNSSGKEDLDRRTLNFAIYWQICTILDLKLESLSNLKFDIYNYQQCVQNLVNKNVSHYFDTSEIVNRNINKQIYHLYENENFFEVESNTALESQLNVQVSA